jgi:hypothetical protein
MSKSRNQFSLTRAASGKGRGAEGAQQARLKLLFVLLLGGNLAFSSGTLAQNPAATRSAAPKAHDTAAVTAVKPLALILVGDFTMSDKPLIPAYPEPGWGQMLCLYFQPEVRVANHARNGRSSKSFIAEGPDQG